MVIQPVLILLSGIPGAGKSTIAGLLARSYARGVHVEADVLQRMIVSGGLWPDQTPADEAHRQLRQRGKHAALLADAYIAAGFTTVLDDVIIGARLSEMLSDLRTRPVCFVLLAPRLEVVQARNAMRPNKNVFASWQHLHEVNLRETPRVGLWLDTSDITAEESAATILARLDEAVVQWP